MEFHVDFHLHNGKCFSIDFWTFALKERRIVQYPEFRMNVSIPTVVAIWFLNCLKSSRHLLLVLHVYDNNGPLRQNS